jgi:hypothetical protein
MTSSANHRHCSLYCSWELTAMTIAARYSHLPQLTDLVDHHLWRADEVGRHLMLGITTGVGERGAVSHQPALHVGLSGRSIGVAEQER